MTTQSQTSRRRFLTSSGTAIASAALAAGASRAACSRTALVSAADVACKTPSCAKLGWQLGASLYTYRRFPFYEALPLIAEAGLKHIEPAFFLGLDKQRPQLKTNEDLSAEVPAELKQRLAAHGIKMTNFYVNVGTDQAAARPAHRTHRNRRNDT